MGPLSRGGIAARPDITAATAALLEPMYNQGHWLDGPWRPPTTAPGHLCLGGREGFQGCSLLQASPLKILEPFMPSLEAQDEFSAGSWPPLYPPSEILGLLLQQIYRAPPDSERRRKARRRGWKCSICVFPPRPWPPGDPAMAPLAPSTFLERKKRTDESTSAGCPRLHSGVQPHLWAPGAAIPRWLGPTSRRRGGQPAAGTRWNFDSGIRWDLSLARRFLSSTVTSCAGLGLCRPHRPLQP